jgi:hypothetical protein
MTPREAMGRFASWQPSPELQNRESCLCGSTLLVRRWKRSTGGREGPNVPPPGHANP